MDATTTLFVNITTGIDQSEATTPAAMGGGYRRKRTHKAKKAFAKSCRTRRRAKDLDQVHRDLAEHNPGTLAFDEDLPGAGQHPCVECARHFQSETDLVEHRRGKLHKKRLRLLREPPYTQREAEAAGGLSTQSFYSNK